MKRNIAIFGGGSVNWCPGLLRDIYLLDELEGGEVRLLDPDPVGLEAVFALQDVYNKARGKDFKFIKAENLEQLLTGADFVLGTFSPGSMEPYHHDVEIPIAYGVRQPVSMSFGPTLISPALRTVPVAYEMCEGMAKHSPDAWMLNVTNPMTCVTQAMNMANPSGKVVGLCHEFEGQLEMVADIVGHPWDHANVRGNDFAREELNIKIGGVNHFPIITEISHKGEDLYPKLREFAANNKAWYRGGDASKAVKGNVWSNNKEAKLEILRVTGYLPVAGDRHLVEFFGSTCNAQNQYGMAYGVLKTTIRDRERGKAAATAWAQALGRGEKEANWSRSGEQVTDIMKAVLRNEASYCIANLPNSGQIANMPSGFVVETFAWIGPDASKPCPVGDMPGVWGPLMRHQAEVCEKVIEAALDGDRQKVIDAFVMDLPSQALDFRLIPQLVDDLLLACKPWLPRFFKD